MVADSTSAKRATKYLEEKRNMTQKTIITCDGIGCTKVIDVQYSILSPFCLTLRIDKKSTSIEKQFCSQECVATSLNSDRWPELDLPLKNQVPPSTKGPYR